MYLAIDTETTGVPRPHLDLDHPAQPHLLQFAGVLFDDNGREIEHLITLVKPGSDAFMVPQAYEAHRITLERATEKGTEPVDVFHWFEARANGVTHLIGHNVAFDLQVMAILAQRAVGASWTAPCPTFCTMAESADIVNLPPTERMRAAGRHGPKPPGLSECYRHFFGEELVGAHDAGADVDAAIQIFRHLRWLRQGGG